MNENINFKPGMVEETDEFDTYSFYFTDSDGTRDLEARIQLAWDATWTQALEHYLDFLSGIYGYDIKAQVAVKDNPHRLPGDWSGETFKPARKGEIESYGGTE